MDMPRHELLSLVDRSPLHVAAHDRQAWLDLFADDATVEDPVGSPAVRKRDGSLARFWDIFIAPNQVRFEVLTDCVQGDDVLREVVIHTEMGQGVAIRVPAYLLYTTTHSGGGRRLGSLAAHWTLKHSARQARGLGPRAFLPMGALAARMVRRFGPSWMWAYLASQWRGVGLAGVRAAEALAGAVSAADDVGVRALFASADAPVELGERRTSAAGLVGALPAGTRLVIEAPISAGWVTACRFRLEGGSPARGLALLEFDEATKLLRRARFFAPPAA